MLHALCEEQSVSPVDRRLPHSLDEIGIILQQVHVNQHVVLVIHHPQRDIVEQSAVVSRPSIQAFNIRVVLPRKARPIERADPWHDRHEPRLRERPSALGQRRVTARPEATAREKQTVDVPVAEEPAPEQALPQRMVAVAYAAAAAGGRKSMLLIDRKKVQNDRLRRLRGTAVRAGKPQPDEQQHDERHSREDRRVLWRARRFREETQREMMERRGGRVEGGGEVDGRREMKDIGEGEVAHEFLQQAHCGRRVLLQGRQQGG